MTWHIDETFVLRTGASLQLYLLSFPSVTISDFQNQVMLGCGTPVALQLSVISLPSSTSISLLESEFRIRGGTVKCLQPFINISVIIFTGIVGGRYVESDTKTSAKWFTFLPVR